MVTAISNRYTVARGVAARAVNLAFRKLGRTPAPCQTEYTPLHGGDFPLLESLVRDIRTALPAGTPAGAAERLARNYGTAYGDLLRVIAEDPGLAAPIGNSLVLRAEVVHAARAEMVGHLGDCVFQRTELGTAGHPGEAALDECAALVGGELKWTSERRAEELQAVRQRFQIGQL
jgi:glycerol-3-phosphate dehydrogenase